MKLPLRLLSLGALLACVLAAPKPVKDLKVTFVGQKYNVDAADTVEDVKTEVQKQCGTNDATKAIAPCRVLFGGKPLEATAFLRDCGVTDGCQLDMLPDATTSMQELMKQAGVDTDKLDELMGGMGGGGGADGQMPSMEESLKMMSNMMNSPMIQDMLSDPERLEQSRQMILQNPMLKSMMAGMPGMDQLLNDPVAWREAMQAAANMYKNMDSDDMMKAMMGQMGNMDMGDMGGMGGLPGAGGLFDDKNNAAAAALDELSEGED